MQEFNITQEEYKRKESELRAYSGDDRVVSSIEHAEILNAMPKLPKVMSKMPTLDKLTGGFQAGQLIIIGGKPKSGKSLIAQTFTVNFLSQGITSLWFSYEMPALEFFERFPKLPLLYIPQRIEGKSIDWIMNRVIEAKAKYGIKVIFFDHLHFLITLGQQGNASLEIGNVVRNLKRMAINFNLIIFLISHVTKVPKGRPSTVDDLRDSGLVQGEADKVIITNRLKESNAVLTVGVDRQTGVMDQSLQIIKREGLLYEKEVIQ